MTSRLLLSAFCAVALAGCAHHHGQFRTPDPTRPTIVLSPLGQLVVDQEPIVILLKKDEPTFITWRLPPGSGLTFDAAGGGGITIVGRTKDADYKKIPLDTSNNGSFACFVGEKGSQPTRAAQADGAGMRRDEAPVNLQAFTCGLAPTIARGVYQYEISVVSPAGVIRLDPQIMPR